MNKIIFLLFATVILLPIISANPNVFNKEVDLTIKIDPQIEKSVKIFFGIEQTLGFTLLLVLVLISLYLLILLANLLEKTNFFSKIISWAIAIIITSIMALTGTIREIAFFFGSSAENLSSIRNFPTGSNTILFLLIIVAGAILFIIIKHLNKKVQSEISQEKGEKAGNYLSALKKIFKSN